jgi:uncharacterized protein (TIGR03435 family)
MTKWVSLWLGFVATVSSLLTAAGTFAVICCPARGQAQTAAAATAQAATPVLEVATIKPVKDPSPNNMRDRTEGRRLTARNVTVRDLIMMGYELDPGQILGGPAWMGSDEYDIDAEAVEGVDLDNERKEEMLFRELLADRFKLTFHHEQRTLAVYLLVVAKSGPKLKSADPQGVENSACEHAGVCTFRKRTLSDFARFMQFVVLDRPVVDKTGIAGTFDFTLKWTPDESQFSRLGLFYRPPAEDSSLPPPLFKAIEEQLGLKLEPEKIPAEVLVIDKVERPTAN